MDGARIAPGNISNSAKGVEGIQCFQILQDRQEEVTVNMVCSSRFDALQEAKFKDALRQRLGATMRIGIVRVTEIPRERSGKFRILKNSMAT
ncbi:hypothetical protein D3C78_1458380 [compost metagenome]